MIYFANSEDLTDVADELRTACGTSAPLEFPTDFIAAIRSLYDPLNTFTGSVVRFASKFMKPIEKLKATFAPVQSGSGDPSPDNVRPISGTSGIEVTRAGKNLMELSLSEMVISGWNVNFPFTIKPGTYIISCQNQFGGTTTKGASVGLSDANGNNLLTLSGYDFGNTAYSGASKTVTEAVAAATTTITFRCAEGIDVDEAESILSAGLQLEFGSTATEYEVPKGKTVAAHFPALGKNLFDESRYQNLATELEYISNSYRCKEIQLEPYTQYTISHRAGTADSSVILLLNNSKVVNDGGYFDCRTASGSKTYTTDATGKLYIGTLNTSDASNNARLALCQIQIEAGDTATAYEPYINTVYSGTAECNADGTWTVTATDTGSPQLLWVRGSANNAGTGRIFYAYYTRAETNVSTITMTNGALKTVTRPSSWEAQEENSISFGTTNVLIVTDDVNTALADLPRWLSNKGLQLIGTLKTPVTVTISGEQLVTLAEENNVWADCGDIEVQAYGTAIT